MTQEIEPRARKSYPKATDDCIRDLLSAYLELATEDWKSLQQEVPAKTKKLRGMDVKGAKTLQLRKEEMVYFFQHPIVEGLFETIFPRIDVKEIREKLNIPEKI